jgi:hypothetical protein
MQTRSIFAFASLALAFVTGCGPAPLDVVVDNTPMSFNRGVTWRANETSGTWQLTISGSADPVANAVDDEYSLTLRIGLDDAMRASAPRGVPLTVHGVAQFAAPSDTPAGPDGAIASTYEAEADQSPLVRTLATTASCFCGRGGNETQTYSGTITLADAEPNAVRVQFDLTLDGQIPFRTPAGQSSHVVLRGAASAPLNP